MIVQPGEKRRTKAKQRVIICHYHLNPHGRRKGKIEFFFEDEGPKPFHQRMGYKKWTSYDLAS